VWSPGVWLEGSNRPWKHGPAPARALIIGPPAIEGESAAAFPPLPDAMREARAVATLFPRVTFLAGKQATLEAIEREMPVAEVFHFAGHGFSNASGGGLILASSQGGREPAVLDSRRIRQMQFRECRLAVLSACSTGTGENDELVDPEDLASSFLRAGVRAVIAARWRIDSTATASLMSDFYEALLAGREPEQALRDAASQLRRRPGTGHPYYWAAFSTFGSRNVID
jgi:CHAT domain-containing protein